MLEVRMGKWQLNRYFSAPVCQNVCEYGRMKVVDLPQHNPALTLKRRCDCRARGPRGTFRDEPSRSPTLFQSPPLRDSDERGLSVANRIRWASLHDEPPGLSLYEGVVMELDMRGGQRSRAS
jgi:hypothetical protein